MVLDSFLPMCGKEDSFSRVAPGTTVEV